MTRRFLLNDEDLKVILNVTQDEILDMIAHGMPHYYCENHFYFDYLEVQEFILNSIELGYIGEQAEAVTDYIREVTHEELDPEDLRGQLKRYMREHRGLSDYRLVWLYNNCGGDKYSLFCQYLSICFPKIKPQSVYKYYLALLKTIMDIGSFNDKINHYYEDER